MKNVKWLISLGIFVIALSFVGSAYALPTLLTDQITKLKLNNFERWTDVNTNGWVDQGDKLEGIFDITTIGSVDGSIQTWPPFPRTDEITGHFQFTVSAGSMNPADPLWGSPQVAQILGPSDFINVFYDNKRDWDPSQADAITRATNGVPYFSILGADLLESYTMDIVPGQTQTNWWTNLTINNTGYPIIPQLWPEVLGGPPFVHTFPLPAPLGGFALHPGGHVSDMYLEGSVYNYGLYGWDFRSEDPAYLRAVPEPATMLLLGSGLIGMAGFARRRRKVAKK